MVLSLQVLVGGVANPVPLLRSGDELLPPVNDQAVLLLVVSGLVINPVRNPWKCTDIVAIPAYTSPPGFPPLF